MEPHDGEEWMRWASSLYRPLATVSSLASGANPVTIGPEGYAEWRTLKEAAALHIAGVSAWYLYDDGFAKLAKGAGAPADVTAPAGAYLVLFGAAGSRAAVTVAGG